MATSTELSVQVDLGESSELVETVEAKEGEAKESDSASQEEVKPESVKVQEAPEEEIASARDEPQAETVTEESKAGEANDTEEDKLSEESVTKSADEEAKPAEEAAPKKKKKFQAKASPKCTHCGKSVFKTEEVLDSTDSKFHKSCLRCATCKTSLVGRQPIDEDGADSLLKSQYRVADGGNLYCDRHAQKTRGTIVKTTSVDDMARLRKNETKTITEDEELKKKTASVKKEMELTVGDNIPICGRCGGSLDGVEKIVVSGMERFHEVCPENPTEVQQTPRYFIKRQEERPVVMILPDELPDTKALTFIFDLNVESKREALLQKKKSTAKVLFDPDSGTRAGLYRKLASSHKTTEPSFSMSIRNVQGLTRIEPSGFEHTVSTDFVMSGMVQHKNKTRYARLVAFPDVKIVLYNSEADVGKKPAYELLLDGESEAELVERTEKASGGFGVTGRRMKGDKISEEREELQLATTHMYKAQSWFEAVKDAIENIKIEDSADHTHEPICFRYFKVVAGVLHQYVLYFHYSRQLNEIGLRDSGYLLLSQFPEPSLEEEVKADPLANLKKNLEVKKQEEEKEKLRAEAEAKKQAKAEAGGGGCCIVQ